MSLMWKQNAAIFTEHSSVFIPESLDVGGDPWEPVNPIHNAMLLNELSTALKDLGNWNKRRSHLK